MLPTRLHAWQKIEKKKFSGSFFDDGSFLQGTETYVWDLDSRYILLNRGNYESRMNQKHTKYPNLLQKVSKKGRWPLLLF